MKINNRKELDALIKSISSEGMQQGEGISSTREFTNQIIEIDNASVRRMLDPSGFDVPQAWAVIFEEALVSGDRSVTFGPYDMEYYWFLTSAVSDTAVNLLVDNPSSRRCVIDFGAKHCFNSIQFMLRGNKVVASCSMRSCNAKENLLFDIYICVSLCLKFAISAEKALGVQVSRNFDISMLIGSLHVFEGSV